MAKDINLLPDTLNEEIKSEEKKKFSTLLSLLVLLIAGLSVVGLFAYQMMKRGDLENLNKMISVKEKAVGDLNEVEGTIRALDIKLNRLAQFFDSSPDNAGVLQNLTDLASKKITITELNLTGSSLTVGGQANSGSDFNEFLANLLSKDTGGRFFKDPVLKSFSKLPEIDGYRFSITIIT